METRWPVAGQAGSPMVAGPLAGQSLGGMEAPMAPVAGATLGGMETKSSVAARAGRQMEARWLGRGASLGGVARRAIASANGIVTMGWTEAAFRSSGMVARPVAARSSWSLRAGGHASCRSLPKRIQRWRRMNCFADMRGDAATSVESSHATLICARPVSPVRTLTVRTLRGAVLRR